MRWLILDLTAPLASFGTQAQDGAGPTADLPAISAITGLLGAALGYERHRGDLLDDLQSRLVVGARVNPLPDGNVMMQDFQTAQMAKADKGWTRDGLEGRAGACYDGPKLRYRDYVADASVTVVVRLKDEGSPTIDDLAHALAHPEWPLCIGRRPCLPAGPICAGFIEAPDVRRAIVSAPLPAQGVYDTSLEAKVQWQEAGTSSNAARAIPHADLRNFRKGVHQGSRNAMSEKLHLEMRT